MLGETKSGILCNQSYSGAVVIDVHYKALHYAWPDTHLAGIVFKPGFTYLHTIT